MYLAFYGLREEPFRLTPDPNFLHLADSHRAVLVSLIHGIIQRRGFIVTIGAVGTGKTTLLHTALQILTLRQHVGNRLAESAFLVNPTLTREELLESVLDDFEVNCTGTTKPRRLLALREHLLETQRLGGTSVLIVDEAHLLTLELAEEIRLLSNLDSSSDKLLQIVLAGQPELDHLLASPKLSALQQRIAVRTRLHPLTPPEVRLYVSERIKIGGRISTHPFLEPALDEICGLSQGIPRIINLLCDSCLQIGFHAGRLQIGTDIVEKAAVALQLSKPPGQPPAESRPLDASRCTHRRNFF
jgi:general secretion pathway protein A